MKKEVVLAITIGFIVGLVITFVFYRFKIIPGQNNEILSPAPSNNSQGLNNSPSDSVLTIISPLDQSISQEAKTTISGKTNSLSWVVIMGEKGEKMVQADNEGNFQTDLLLISGENEIFITAVNNEGEEISQTLTIVYSTAEI
jgi:hypothetical protein